jgi:hypothetical protein
MDDKDLPAAGLPSGAMDSMQWSTFVGDKPARETAAKRWLELNEKLREAQRLMLDEGWDFDDPWPGVIYRGPTGCATKAIDVETWAFMRALARGMGEQIQRQMDRKGRPL